MLRTSLGRDALGWLACRATGFLTFADVGRDFVFGSASSLVLTFAFGVLPVTIFFGAICSVALHLGLLQLVFEHAGGLGLGPGLGSLFFEHAGGQSGVCSLGTADTPAEWGPRGDCRSAEL